VQTFPIKGLAGGNFDHVRFQVTNQSPVWCCGSLAVARPMQT
jgi:hypothetical protein